MPKIKEIKKIESPIKEIKKEKKIESLDDEVSNINENRPVPQVRRFDGSSTIVSDENAQNTAIRERIVAKEDREEINFRPSYVSRSTDGIYRSSDYIPAGSAESGTLRGNDRMRRVVDASQGLQSAEITREGGDGNQERSYEGERNERKEKRRNLL